MCLHYRIRQLDGTPALNLASFVTTYMDSAAEKLMMENMNKNAIDYEEYPATVDLQNRCGEQSKE